MNKTIKTGLFALMAATIGFTSCKKAEYTFGNIKTPQNLMISAVLQGASALRPAGDGSGKVQITVSAQNALTYKVYFGNGDSLLTSTGTASYQYTTLDTNQYTITVNAVGTGGAISTLSKQIRVLYQFQIPANIISLLTGGSSKNWMIAKDTAGNFGVGPKATFSPDYYKSGPNEKDPAAYAGVVTFALSGGNGITLVDNNQGASFLIAASTGFYGEAANGDGIYAISTGGVKTLGFSVAHSGSDATNSTGIQFSVPGNGLIGFGTGGSTYEVLSLTSTVMVLRNIGIDGNAWYQILRAH